MPSLLVLAGIMEKNGELAVSGFGSEGLHVPPDEEEDDSRALRVALGQLSLLGLGEAEDGGGGSPATGSQDRSNNNNHHSSCIGGGSAGDTGLLTGKSKLCVLYEAPTSETKGRGSNITECVPVPSSEHVAEIVGRQGCKIKALRAKTNTYIKTPVRGEEPVFLITGRKEDVALARREIISAAEHFSMLRASRNKLGGSFNGSPRPRCRARPPSRCACPTGWWGWWWGPRAPPSSASSSRPAPTSSRPAATATPSSRSRGRRAQRRARPRGDRVAHRLPHRRPPRPQQRERLPGRRVRRR
ncbi:hypothetical protein ANANG_G00181770, partial [Anguilla anguilla]